MMFGLDHLGIAKYGKLAADEHPNGWALGAFSYVDGFGDGIPAIERVLATGRCPRVRIHLAWDDDHDITNFRAIEKEASRVSALFKKYITRDCRVSGGCEHTWNAKTAEHVRKIVMAKMPSWVTYVNVPLLSGPRKGALLPGCVNEIHGSKARPIKGRYDFSFDGSNCVDANVTELKKNLSAAETFYFWNCECNGRKNEKDSTKRPQRKNYPTSRHIDSWIYLSTERGDVKLPNGYLCKSHADFHNLPNRDWRPVLIFPIRAGEVVLTTNTGQVISRAKFAGTFDEDNYPVQRYRYYVPEWGYLLSEKAKRISGSPIVQVRINGKVMGTTNLAFRQGGYR